MTGPTHGPESGVEYMNLQFWQVLIVYFCAFAVTMLLVPVSIKIAEKTGGMDVPTDNRRVHTHPIPRLGGMIGHITLEKAADRND